MATQNNPSPFPNRPPAEEDPSDIDSGGPESPREMLLNYGVPAVLSLLFGLLIGSFVGDTYGERGLDIALVVAGTLFLIVLYIRPERRKRRKDRNED